MNQQETIDFISNIAKTYKQEYSWSYNRALRLHYEGDSEEALKEINKAIQQDPKSSHNKCAKAIILFMLGRYEEALPLQEARLEQYDWSGYIYKFGSKLQWDGKPTNKRLIIWSEQGLGDSIQMMRFLPYISEICPNLILVVRPELFRLALYNKLAPHIICTDYGIPDFDVQCSLYSLPFILRVQWNYILGDSYLEVRQSLVDAWKAKIPVDLNTGICWKGSPGHRFDSTRSIADDLVLKKGRKFAILNKDICNTFDIEDFAALIQALDLVITVDTVTAHLAGALGKKTYLMLPTDSDSRWLRNTNKTKWYDSIEIFRQKKAGDWEEVLDRVFEVSQ